MILLTKLDHGKDADSRITEDDRRLIQALASLPHQTRIALPFTVLKSLFSDRSAIKDEILELEVSQFTLLN